jgi:hypothetical protein
MQAHHENRGGHEAGKIIFELFSLRALCALRGNKIGRAPRGAMTFFQRKQAGFTTKFTEDAKASEPYFRQDKQDGFSKGTDWR